jgi:hemerythrin superfamily protein
MPNATQLLRQDHKKVQSLFSKCEQAKGMDAKKRFAMQAMNELEVHAQIEEEIFYPAVRKAIEETDIVDEAKQEHQEAKGLITELKGMQGQEADDDGEDGMDEFESKFSELVEAVQHHVEEEEGEMFPKVEDSELDLSELGAEMGDRKRELMQEIGASNGRSGAKSRSKTKTKTKAKSKSSRSSKSRSGSARKSSRGKRSRA